MWCPQTISGSLEWWWVLPSWTRWRLLIWRIPRLTKKDSRKLQGQRHCCSRIISPSRKRPLESLLKFFLAVQRIGGASSHESLYGWRPQEAVITQGDSLRSAGIDPHDHAGANSPWFLGSPGSESCSTHATSADWLSLLHHWV